MTKRMIILSLQCKFNMLGFSNDEILPALSVFHRKTKPWLLDLLYKTDALLSQHKDLRGIFNNP